MSHSEVQNQQGRKLFSSHGARERVNSRRKIQSLMSKDIKYQRELAFTTQNNRIWCENDTNKIILVEHTMQGALADFLPMFCTIKDLSKAIQSCF